MFQEDVLQRKLIKCLSGPSACVLLCYFGGGNSTTSPAFESDLHFETNVQDEVALSLLKQARWS